MNGSGNAGGLMGSATGTTVSACYSGGHTYSGAPDYSSLAAGVTKPNPERSSYPARYYNDKNEPIYNVTGGTTAGGLIGSAGDSTISYSYSTCSATGATAGGFVGTSTGSITDCYCTGLVSGTTEGAFAGNLTGTASGCQYFEIINERHNVDEKDSTKEVPGYHYLKALGGDTDGGIAKLDATWGTYQEFSRAPTEWKDAHPYDSGLTRNYQNKYNLRTVEQLGATLKTDDDDATVYFVKDHYGDWPAPEEFVFNAG